MRKSVIKILVLFLSVGLWSSFAIGQEDLGPRKNLFKVHTIRIDGNKKVEEEAVLEKISAKVGMVVDNYIIRDDIQKIYKMKYFETVEVHHVVENGNDILIYKVVEKPIVSKIIFNGNDDLDDDELLGQIKTKEFSILDVNTIKADVGNILKFYEEKGYYLAAIDYELNKVEQENVEVIFNIKELDKVKVKKITFLGTTAFSDDEIKGIMETREEGFLSSMTGSGNFKEFNFNTDIERIKYFYKTKGFLQVNVGAPEVTISEDRRWVFISMSIKEGPQFTINDISFDGELLFTVSELNEKISLKEDEIYSEDNLRKDIQVLTELYQDEGYAFANVLRTLDVVPGENKVNVRFSFEKGKIAYFGKIIVKGNNKTRDKVVRRELQIEEGMKFSGSKLRISKENVNRLGFFEPNSVIFNTVTPKGRDDVLDVEITVKERNTGQITLGAGYSTSTGAFLQGSISQNNFRGLGQILSFSLNWSDNSKNFNLGFTEPYLFDTKWTAGGDIFNSRQENDDFSYDRQGFNARVGYPIFDYTKLFLTYKLEDTEIRNSEDPTLDENVENGIASSVESSLIHDKRNNKFEPTNGHYSSVSLEYAGVGGDKKWVKSELDTRMYASVWGDLVFRYRFNAAKLDMVDDRPIPRSEKYVLGGARNLRGYNFRDIGPLEERVVDNRRQIFNLGGLFYLVSTVEFEHPLVREAGLKWVIFFDTGNVYDKYIGYNSDYSLKSDYGFGFRWFSPIGVLRFEFGYPLDKVEKINIEKSQFHFDIGQLF